MKQLILVTLIILTSCESKFEISEIEIPETKNAIINYHLSIVPTDQFDSLSFSFLYTRAFQNYTSIRTVYLDQAVINVKLDKTQIISLGSSSIEPLFIEGYDFGLGNFKLRQGDKSIDQFVWGLEEAFAKAEFIPTAGDTIDVYFEFDIEASIKLDSASKNWITPKILLKRM